MKVGDYVVLDCADGYIIGKVLATWTLAFRIHWGYSKYSTYISTSPEVYKNDAYESLIWIFEDKDSAVRFFKEKCYSYAAEDILPGLRFLP